MQPTSEQLWYEEIDFNCLNVWKFKKQHPYVQMGMPHVPECWLPYFQFHSAQARASGDKNTCHRMLVSIMLQTMSAVNNGSYFVAPSTLIQLNKATLRSCTSPLNTAMCPNWQLSPLPPPPLGVSPVVQIFNADSVEVAVQMILDNPGSRPLVLNMASSTSPGGGFKRGHWAQEESLMRRSNYWLAIDSDFGAPPPSVQYPIPSTGTTISQNVVVFRGSERLGYPFLATPLLLDFIAVAAIKGPALSAPGTIAEPEASETYAKICSIFHIAAASGFTELVLGSFGCGAFKNPPRHIALLFCEAIRAYAKYFKRICFGIYDDINAPQGGNLQVFCDVFQCPPTIIPELQLNQAYLVASRRSPDLFIASNVAMPTSPVLNSFVINPINILGFHPVQCRFGGLCKLMTDPTHCREFEHPKMCDFGANCRNLNSKEHMVSFCHPPACRYAGLCDDINNPHHCSQFLHPPPCVYAGACTIYSPSHAEKYSHPPPCRYGPDCRETGETHCREYRHAQTDCKFGKTCAYIPGNIALTPAEIILHLRNFRHPFLPPCTFQPNCTKVADDNHTTMFSHHCWYGAQCNKLGDGRHCNLFTHAEREMCRFGTHCTKMADGIHMQQFSHPHMRDLRRQCKYGIFCLDKSVHHRMEYDHPASNIPICEIRMLNKSIDFYGNKETMFSSLNQANGGRVTVNPKILSWVRKFRPMHRCKPDVMKLIVKHGVVVSLKFQEYLQKNPYYAALQEVYQHAAIRNFLARHAAGFDTHKPVSSWAKLLLKSVLLKGIHVSKKDTKVTRSKVDTLIGRDSSAQLKQMVLSVAETVKTHQTKGIGYCKDTLLGTDDQVFTVVGPTLRPYGYGNIVLVFSQDIMYHPDFNMSPHAATGYIDYPPKPGEVETYHRAKTTAAIDGWDELIAATIQERFKGHSIEQIKHSYTHQDPHICVEGHLPSTVPLSYVEKIVICQKDLDALDAGDPGHTVSTRLRHAFRDRPGETILVVPTEAEVLPEAMKFMLPKRTSAVVTPHVQRTGFEFALVGKKETVIPLRMKHKGQGTIFFEAVGSDIRICITKSPEKTHSSKNHMGPNSCYTVGLLTGRDRSSWVCKGLSPHGSPLIVHAPFSEMFQNVLMSGPVGYRITYNGHKGIVTLENCANHFSVSLHDKFAISGLQFVTVASMGHCASFFNFQVS
ncbi:TIGR02452 family protein [Pelomyxa schiedti]|nr:TIGR02452 family protein [Pelomyxa schiedti]